MYYEQKHFCEQESLKFVNYLNISTDGVRNISAFLLGDGLIRCLGDLVAHLLGNLSADWFWGLPLDWG